MLIVDRKKGLYPSRKICDACGQVITEPPMVVLAGKERNTMFYHLVCASHTGQKLVSDAQEFALLEYRNTKFPEDWEALREPP